MQSEFRTALTNIEDFCTRIFNVLDLAKQFCFSTRKFVDAIILYSVDSVY